MPACWITEKEQNASTKDEVFFRKRDRKKARVRVVMAVNVWRGCLENSASFVSAALLKAWTKPGTSVETKDHERRYGW